MITSITSQAALFTSGSYKMNTTDLALIIDQTLKALPEEDYKVKSEIIDRPDGEQITVEINGRSFSIDIMEVT